MIREFLQKFNFTNSTVPRRFNFLFTRKKNLIEAAYDQEISKKDKEKIISKLGRNGYLFEMEKRDMLRSALMKSEATKNTSEQKIHGDLILEKDIVWSNLQARIEQEFLSKKNKKSYGVLPFPSVLFPRTVQVGSLAFAVTIFAYFIFPEISVEEANQLGKENDNVIAALEKTQEITNSILTQQDQNYRLKQYRLNLSSARNAQPNLISSFSGSQLISQRTLDLLAESETDVLEKDEYVNESNFLDNQFLNSQFNSPLFAGLEGSAPGDSTSIYFVSND